ncbi:hypothetical protein [Streptomyces longispororuber]|nr:hypothetical protein [Streptomyces longispororuber]
MAEVFLRRLSRWQAEQQREDVASVYAACHGRDRAEFLKRFEREVQERDFDMVVADSAGGLVGCLYGYRAAPEAPAYAGFVAALHAAAPEAAAGAAAGRLFLLAELMVLPGHRRRGTATRLRDLLLSRHRTDVVVTTLAAPGDGTGREVLRAWACTRLGEFAAPPGEAWLHPAGR